MKSTIAVDVICNSATAGGMFGILPHTDPLTTNTWSYFAERPLAKVCPNMMGIANRYGSQLRHSATVYNVCGLNKAESMEEDYGASISASPTRQWYWTVFAQSSDSSSVVNCFVRVRVVYYLQFYDRDDISQSFDVSRKVSLLAERAQRNLDQFREYNVSQVEQGKKHVRVKGVGMSYTNVALVSPPPQLPS